MKKVELVVFDLAGTTVKDNGNVAQCFMNAFRQYDMEVGLADVNEVMGFRKKDAINILLGKLQYVDEKHTEELIEKIHDAFIQGMIAFYEDDADLQPLPQAEEVFTLLHKWGIKRALNTGFTKAITDVILRRLQWTVPGTADAVISSDEVPQGRPHPDMIRSLMTTLNIWDPSHVVKVGDTSVDVQEGRNAGCGLVVSVTSGAYSRKELEKFYPDQIIGHLSELPALIQLNR